MALFQEFWRGVLAAHWKGPISCDRRGYTETLYRQRMLFFGPWAYGWRSRSKTELPSTPLSWCQPFTGPYKLAIKPFEATIDWKLIMLAFFWLLYSMRLSFLGLQMGRTVPSMNPQQLSKGDLLAWIVSAKSWRLTSASHYWFIHKVHDMITVKTKFWRRSFESTDHVRISAWIGKSFQECIKRFVSTLVPL